jgi:hypothetical protein
MQGSRPAARRRWLFNQPHSSCAKPPQKPPHSHLKLKERRGSSKRTALLSQRCSDSAIGSHVDANWEAASQQSSCPVRGILPLHQCGRVAAGTRVLESSLYMADGRCATRTRGTATPVELSAAVFCGEQRHVGCVTQWQGINGCGGWEMWPE